MTDTLLDSAQPRCERDSNAATAHWTSRIAAGDPEAFGAFYEAWFERVFAMARGISRRDESFCLDVVQDCMMRVVKSISRMQDEAAIGTWLARAVYSATIDRLRSEQRRRRREHAFAAGTRGCEAVDPMVALQGSEERAWLASQLAELAEADRVLVLARFEGGMTLARVGERFGMSGHCAHGRIRRVLARLRRAAQEWIDER